MNNLPQNLPLISDKSIFSTKFSTIDLEVRNSNLDFFFFWLCQKKNNLSLHNFKTQTTRVLSFFKHFFTNLNKKPN